MLNRHVDNNVCPNDFVVVSLSRTSPLLIRVYERWHRDRFRAIACYMSLSEIEVTTVMFANSRNSKYFITP